MRETGFGFERRDKMYNQIQADLPAEANRPKLYCWKSRPENALSLMWRALYDRPEQLLRKKKRSTTVREIEEDWNRREFMIVPVPRHYSSRSIY